MFPEQQPHSGSRLQEGRPSPRKTESGVHERVVSIMTRPAGSSRPGSRGEQFLPPSADMDTPEVLADLPDTSSTRTLITKRLNGTRLLRHVEDVRGRRMNPDLQAMIRRWEGRPITSPHDWRDKMRDYKSGGYILYPQTPEEEAWATQAKAEIAREQEPGHPIAEAAAAKRLEELKSIFANMDEDGTFRHLAHEDAALLKRAFREQRLDPESTLYQYVQDALLQPLRNTGHSANRNTPPPQPIASTSRQEVPSAAVATGAKRSWLKRIFGS